MEAPYKDSVDWSKWWIFWVDERVVPLDHPDSNYLLAWNGFLSKVLSLHFPLCFDCVIKHTNSSIVDSFMNFGLFTTLSVIKDQIVCDRMQLGVGIFIKL